MQWVLLLVLAFAPPTTADRVRAINRANEAVKMEMKNNSEQAVTLAKEAIELDGSYAKAHYLLGQIESKRGRHAAAVAAFKGGLAVVGEDPLGVDLNYRLAVSLQAEGDAPGVTSKQRQSMRLEAMAALSETLSRDPMHYKAYYRRGRMHDWLGDPDAADADFRTCIRVRPTYSSCFSALAGLYVDYGFAAEALEVIAVGVEANDKDAVMWSAAGRIYMDLGRPKDAVDKFKKAKAIDPDMVEVMFGLGMVYAELRQRKESVEHLELFLMRAGTDVDDGRKVAARNTIARMEDVF